MQVLGSSLARKTPAQKFHQKNQVHQLQVNIQVCRLRNKELKKLKIKGWLLLFIGKWLAYST